VLPRLVAGARTIAEIAHASGFADHAHFCRSFRAAKGTSPTRFRAAARAL
jgi:AraC-like DNA-binding protein